MATKVVQNLSAPLENPQPQPNEERFLQPAPAPSLTPTDEPPVITPTPSSEQDSSEQSQPFQVNKIEVAGSTIFGPENINPIVQPLQARSVTLEDLQNATQTISQLYINAGYITSRAVLDEESISTGTVKIRVIEAGIEEIRVQGTRRLNPNYVRDRIQLGVGRPLNANKLEAQLRLLRIDPLFASVEASLQAGTKEGQSILTVRVTESKPFNVSFGFDNYSPLSIAPERASVALNYRNLSGIGDQLSVSYAVGANIEEFSRAALNLYDLTYRAPLNALDGTLQFRAALHNSKITDEDFDQLGIRGKSEVYELSYRQPLVRTLRKEFALSLGLTFQDGQTFVNEGNPFPFGRGVDEEGNSRTRVLKFGQDYISRDPQGTWVLRSQFNFGLNILNATENRDDLPDGSFFSFQGQAQRSQFLGNDYLLIMQGSLQLSADPLLPSQQFFIGGGQSLRGYRQSVRTGDNGLLFSVEGRIPVQKGRSGRPILQLAPFTDLGGVWNVSGNPNLPQNQRFIASVGLGLLWQPTPSFGLRIDYGIPLIDLEDRRDSLQDNGIHFSFTYNPL